ncbi:serine/threonine-protein kinase [Streptomyces hainanensis]|uniref:serine/threonine-protein kinase n=1 Tax=Streptomyces hainanensis TaxID=402648 RepID=UPI001404C4BA|nr:serine/threonine-protein kinase [Streptomyces hainanensis]
MRALGANDPTTVGSYRLLRRLGAGGMGRVYLGRSPGGRMVAVKLVHEELAADPEFRRRFAREVAAAQRVGGRWTAPVLECDTESAVPWVATGYVPGPSLQDVVGAPPGPLPEPTVWALLHGLARALTEIHRNGLVHRDLKPSNILVTLDGPKVIDFGIARAVDASMMTRTDAVVGSPGYLAPEQVRGERVTTASDVFALGAVLVHASTGVGPFTGDQPPLHTLFYRVLHEDAELGPPSGPLSGDLRELTRLCLSKAPARRPTVADLAATSARRAGDGLDTGLWLPPALTARIGRDLAQVLELELPSAEPTPAPPPPLPRLPRSPDAPPTTGGPSGPTFVPPSPPSPPPPNRRRRLVLACALLCVVVTAALIAFLTRPGDEQDPAANGDGPEGTAPSATTESESVPEPEQLGDPEAPLYHLLPDEVKRTGTIRVLAATGVRPYSYRDDGGNVAGVEVDLLGAIDALLGVDFVFEQVGDSESPLSRLAPEEAASGESPVVAIGGFVDDPTVRGASDLSFVNHYQEGSVLVTDEGEAVESLVDICGGTVVSWDADYFRYLVTEGGADCDSPVEFQPGADIEGMLRTVRTGSADAALLPYGSVVDYLDTYEDGGGGRALSARQFGVGPHGIAVPEADPDLAEAIRSALRYVMDDGTYTEILDEWGVPDVALESPTINAAH